MYYYVALYQLTSMYSSIISTHLHIQCTYWPIFLCQSTLQAVPLALYSLNPIICLSPLLSNQIYWDLTPGGWVSLLRDLIFST